MELKEKPIKKIMKIENNFTYVEAPVDAVALFYI
jgi:hypothetical protein